MDYRESEAPGFLEAFNKAAFKFLFPLQMPEGIDRSAFAELHESARALARALKGVEGIPKSVLNAVYTTFMIIDAEAWSGGDQNRETLLGMSGDIQECFSLILRDESPEDRVPGVPRIR